jgi:hypothetical protein
MKRPDFENAGINLTKSIFWFFNRSLKLHLVIMKPYIIILLFCYLISSSSSFSQNAQNQFSDESIINRLLLLNELDNTKVLNSEILFESDQKIATIHHLSPQGFIIISETNHDVIGFSFENNFAASGTGERSISDDLVQYANTIAYQKIRINGAKDAIYGPYVYNMWGQVNCTDNQGHSINVTNIYTPSHYAVGCVAISQATILKHYNWPPKGVGSESYSDNLGSSTGTYVADFAQTEYRLEQALDRYRGKSSELVEREIAGLAAYHSAVALNMNFESNGSTSNVNKIPTALATYFRFTALYKDRSASSFWTILDSNMVWGKPAVLAVENSSGSGHSIVCDGLKIEDGVYYYHLNMGWWGTSNGWYQIRGSFNAGGYNYILGGAMNIMPEPMVMAPVILDDAPMAQLCWQYPANANPEAFEIQRSINGGTWQTLNDNAIDTSVTVFLQPSIDYEYRVRAKTNGVWYNNSWSEPVSLIRTYTSILEQEPDLYSFSPNPFSNRLIIHNMNENTGFSSIFVVNEWGYLVYKNQTPFFGLLDISTQQWAKGVYLVHISSKNKKKVVKLVKI